MNVTDLKGLTRMIGALEDMRANNGRGTERYTTLKETIHAEAKRLGITGTYGRFITC